MMRASSAAFIITQRMMDQLSWISARTVGQVKTFADTQGCLLGAGAKS